MRGRRLGIDVLDADLRASARRLAAEAYELARRRETRRDPAGDAAFARALTRKPPAPAVILDLPEAAE